MARYVFPSNAFATKYGYVYDSSEYDYRATVSYHMLQFQTYGEMYGDKPAQHSASYAITREYMADYLASLAKAIMANIKSTGDDERPLASAIGYEFGREIVSPAAIEFAAGIIFKPGEGMTYYEAKARFFSIEERKITTNQDKQYDKRYTKVESSHDGTPKAVYNMVLPEFSRAIDQYAIAAAVKEYFNDLPGKKARYVETPPLFLGWPEFVGEGKHERARDLRYAFQAVTCLVKAHNLRSEAECALGNIRVPSVPGLDETQEVS